MTLLVALAVVAPSSWLAVLLQDQLAEAYRAALSFGTAGGVTLPPFVRQIPWLGETVQPRWQ